MKTLVFESRTIFKKRNLWRFRSLTSARKGTGLGSPQEVEFHSICTQKHWVNEIPSLLTWPQRTPADPTGGLQPPPGTLGSVERLPREPGGAARKGAWESRGGAPGLGAGL